MIQIGFRTVPVVNRPSRPFDQHSPEILLGEFEVFAVRAHPGRNTREERLDELAELSVNIFAAQT
jgi:hypothetical protein